MNKDQFKVKVGLKIQDEVPEDIDCITIESRIARLETLAMLNNWILTQVVSALPDNTEFKE